ncbi:MAG TPA: lipoyl(octanoyl) transferase LipB [Candidatus Saccharimonadales bacterium]|nr:lipoyl(octanoyl) transferase LipB [Candidatus Saccharimonadales bacterium]
MAPSLHATALGRIGYLDAWRLQEAVAARIRAGGPERLLLLEHDPVYTIGRRGSIDHLTASPDELRATGASAYRVDRGGDITYHGPGQLVGYPLVSLGEHPDVVGYVRALESALIAVLGDHGIAGRTVEGRTGVWVSIPDGRDAKIAAIGVRVTRGIAMHGFALNVSTDLAAFDRMIPCGFVHEVASFERLGVQVPLQDVIVRVGVRLAEGLGRELRWDDRIAPPADDEIPAGAPVREAEDLLTATAA